jgi:hypothetical protein
VPLDVAENRDALDLLVRSTLPLERTASLIREAVRGADPDLPVGDVAALTALLADSTRGQRFRVALLVVFSGAATLLAALGLFGSTTRMARARSRELGIRLALGARRPKLLLEVVRAESGMLAGGLAMGLAGAYFAAGQVRAYLFELSPADPVTWLASGAVLFTVALSSTLWAAGGAMRVDPVETLRAE